VGLDFPFLNHNAEVTTEVLDMSIGHRAACSFNFHNLDDQDSDAHNDVKDNKHPVGGEEVSYESC
jgi:hypothetical protein